MWNLSWPLIFGLAGTGIIMALLSCLIGMRQRVEIPAWWLLYAGWVVVVLLAGEPPFRTILVASVLAGLAHAVVQSLLMNRYIQSNPWYADQMRKPRGQLVVQFLVSGIAIGAGFGALVAGIAWGIDRL